VVLRSTTSIESYEDFGSDGYRCESSPARHVVEATLLPIYVYVSGELLARCARGVVSEPAGGRTPPTPLSGPAAAGRPTPMTTATDRCCR